MILVLIEETMNIMDGYSNYIIDKSWTVFSEFM